MINIKRTIEVFGYHPNDLKPQSNKYVIHNCQDCNKERQVIKSNITNGHILCMNCRFKGERNPYKGIKGKNSPNYKDGRTLEIHICAEPGCNSKIDFRCTYCNKHSQLGTRSSKYIDGRSSLHETIRGCQLSKNWAEAVYKKDNYICVKCGNKNCRLDAHHNKKSFKQILSEFLQFYNNFSPLEEKEILVRLAKTWEPFWLVENGITLCEKCHEKLHAKIGK